MTGNEILFFAGVACIPAAHYVMTRLLCLVTLGKLSTFRYRRIITALLSVAMCAGVYYYMAAHAWAMSVELMSGLLMAGLVWLIYCAFSDIRAPRQTQATHIEEHRAPGHHSPEC